MNRRNIPEAGDIISFDLSRVKNAPRSHMWHFVLSILDMGAPHALVLDAFKHPENPSNVWRVTLLNSKGRALRRIPIDVEEKSVAHVSKIPYEITRKKQ